VGNATRLSNEASFATKQIQVRKVRVATPITRSMIGRQSGSRFHVCVQ